MRQKIYAKIITKAYINSIKTKEILLEPVKNPWEIPRKYPVLNFEHKPPCSANLADEPMSDAAAMSIAVHAGGEVACWLELQWQQNEIWVLQMS